ncbi:AAA family ATPase [Phyllobacterium pellucidum]|uniref:AAA family ATPase n=1 Tax=Phyllobacterium pellucidum TaxID=2740464 RepID=UPI001D1476DB|nr:AAA family ATPase [Phyllobacterium sp. T1018]UGY10185.1 AAA family ATPase [Phyllobacterium sp. T1018]
MKLEKFEVIGLLKQDRVVSGNLHGDLSILTGRNGAGKTSLLKLIWYILSGNILQALKEVPFERATIVTSEYQCVVHRLSAGTCKVEIIRKGVKEIYEDVLDEDNDVIFNAEDMANQVLIGCGSSVFLPTFRRLEGGFSLNSQTRSIGPDRTARPRTDIADAMLSLSRRMSNEPHIFVSSISTDDIVGLLLRQYADLSETYNRFQQQTSQEIISRIRDYKTDKIDVVASADEEKIETANSVIDEIRNKIEIMEARRGEIMTPIEGVRILVEKLFKHTGIKIGTRLSFGDAASAVSSDALSAGEKQMLSFICYNAFYKDSIFFIDEPELSLHVDWQRQLFPMLLAQQSSNQFLIATHSPFIYSKYPDKEVSVDADRGDEEE